MVGITGATKQEEDLRSRMSNLLCSSPRWQESPRACTRPSGTVLFRSISLPQRG